MNAINWFEIPAADFDSTVRFYESILNTTLQRHEFYGQPHGFLPATTDGVGGAIVSGNGLPSPSGALIYLNATDEAKLDDILSRVPGAGGEVLMPKTPIPPQGMIAVIRDSEGNRIGLHIPQTA
jgi:uncharacterized protein